MIDERKSGLEATASDESSEEAGEEEPFVKDEDPTEPEKFLLENNFLKDASTFTFFQEAYLTKIFAEASNLSLNWEMYKSSVPTSLDNLEIPLLAIKEMLHTHLQEMDNLRNLKESFPFKDGLPSQDTQPGQSSTDLAELRQERDAIKRRLQDKEKQLAWLHKERKVASIDRRSRSLSRREARKRSARWSKTSRTWKTSKAGWLSTSATSWRPSKTSTTNTRH